MQKEITLSSIAILLSVILTLSACTKAKDNTVTLTIVGNIKIDGKSTENFTNLFSPLASLSFNTLTDADPYTNKYLNILVKDARTGDNGKTWDITIRDNVKFHDGMPLTSKDVVSSIEKRKEIESRLNAIVSAEALSRTTVRLTLADPVQEVSDLLNAVTVYPAHISMNGKSWREALLKTPVGSGPFRFNRWIEKGAVFVANKDYFEGPPGIDRVVYLFEGDENRQLASLLRGDADVMVPLSPRIVDFIRKDSKFRISKFEFPYYSALFLNNKSPIFNDSRVRRAVNIAINKESLIEKVLEGAAVPAHSPFNKEMLPDDYRIVPYEYDPKTAASLLLGAGWKDSNRDGIREKGGKRLIIQVLYIGAEEESRMIADNIAKQLYEVGIAVETHPVSYTDFAGKSQKSLFSLNYDALLASRVTYYPEATWQSRSENGALTYNYSDYSNNAVDILFRQAKNTNSHDTKYIYAKIDQLIHDDSPAVFLYTPVSYAATNRRFREARINTPFDIYKIKDWKTENN